MTIYTCITCGSRFARIADAQRCHKQTAVYCEEDKPIAPDKTDNTITPDELAVICKTVVELAEIRQRGCKHLCVENFAVECFGSLLAEYAAHKKGETV